MHAHDTYMTCYKTVAVTGSRYELHADEDGCCKALVYDIILSQDSTMPPAMKDEDWFVGKLQELFAGWCDTGCRRWFYLLDSR